MLFQPSNIYPSTFSGIGAGTVDVTQGLNVSWQVNGDTPMTDYQIRIYQNDTDSTLMYDSGKQAVTPAFEPHDKYGNPTFFNTLISAASLSSAGIVNGYQYGYKMLITQWWDTNDYVEQTSVSVFITRSTPTLVIDAIPNPVATNSITITATYTQDEGDPISTVEWVFAQAGSESTPIKETGAISTQVLSFEADGLITGNTYSIMCNIVTSNGMEASTGFVQFNVSYPSITGDIGCQVAQMKNSSAVYLSWNQIGGNVLKYPYEDSTKTVNGITFTVNDEGNVTASGTASADATFDLESGTLSALKLYAGEKLLITTLNDSVSIQVTETDAYGNVVSTVTGTDPLQYIVPETENTLTFSVLVKNGQVLSSETLQPMMYIEDDITAINDLTITMTPVQDLHGYANPWPAGGGVSKCPTFADGTHTLSNGLTVNISNGKITINGTPSGEGVYQESIQSTVLPSDAYVSLNNPSASYNTALVFINGSTQVATAVPAPANRTVQPTGLSGATVNALRIYFNGSGSFDNFELSPIVHSGAAAQPYSPYENLCLITGHESATVWHTGVNIWDEQWENGYYNRATGEKDGNSNTTYFRSKNYIPCVPNTSYYFKAPSVHASNTTYYAVLFYDADKNYISAINSGIGNTVQTTPQNAQFMTFYIEVGTSGATYNNDISINYPSSDTEYAKHRDTQYHVEFPVLGKNMLDPSEIELYSGVIYFAYRNTGFILKANTAYTFSLPSNVSQLSIADKSGSPNLVAANNARSVTYTPTEDTEVCFRVDFGTATVTDDWQLELGSSASAFEPYTTTVYQGTLDIVSDVLQLTGKKYTISSSDLSPSTLPSKEGNLWRVFFKRPIYDSDNTYKSGLCDKYVVKESYTDVNNTNNSIGFNNSTGVQCLIRNDTFASSADVVASFPIEFLYPLATPIEFHLTPHEMALFFGANNVWSDAGTVTLNYTTNMGRKETLSGDIVSFSDSNAVVIPEPVYRPGVLGVEVYRYSQDDPILRRVYSFTGDTSSLLDYYAPSQKPVSYLFVAHGSSEDVFVVTDQFKPTFWFYSILLCSQDSNGNYHVEKEYVFNNNEPTIQKNFTPYPNRQPASSLYKTGKVTGYIGTVSGAKVYTDSISLQNAIYAISTSPMTKFIKTRKGDVIMMDTASSIQMKTDDNTVQQALKATVDWVEMGDTEGLSIVSVPNDSFWPINS